MLGARLIFQYVSFRFVILISNLQFFRGYPANAIPWTLHS